MFKEIAITKKFQEFNCFITLFGQSLGVFTVEYDGPGAPGWTKSEKI